ncbi:hypothetical protein [Calothrix rhizosoleniae]|uniref:hypothetical protein n=1 Tax=Calothrix rhizosoleniae TaxID=888997 RepID=UPI001178752B|nr:hypothetical protein [Calothrix rhizosoleniae]
MNSKLITPSERLSQRHLTAVALCRGTPLGCASCFMPGNPSTAMAYRPPQWLTVHRNGLLITY